MPKVLFKRKTTEEIEVLPTEDGSFIIDTETGKTYIDTPERRIQIPGSETPLIDINGTPSDTNTYHANAINELLNNERILFEGKLSSRQSISKDFNQYKRLLITCCVYDFITSNSGGVSNIMILDLTKNGDAIKDYVATNAFAYISGDLTEMNSSMCVACVVDSNKTTFTPYFSYNGSILDSSSGDRYYVSKIVGIK